MSTAAQAPDRSNNAGQALGERPDKDSLWLSRFAVLESGQLLYFVKELCYTETATIRLQAQTLST